MAEEPQTPAEGGKDAHAADTTLFAGNTVERTFTQADLDRQIGERLARERAKYADYDDVKKKAVEFDELEASRQSDQEKAISAAVKEERKKNLLEYETERRSNRLQIAVANHARELADVDDVVLNLQKGDTNELFNNEGQVDDQSFGKALEDLLERKPHLRGGGQVPTGDADAGRGATPATLPPEQQHTQDLLGALGLKPQ